METKEKNYGTIFDDVFRTIVEKMPELVIPLINEAFHANHPEDAEVVQMRNEHQTLSGERTTDSYFLVGGRMYHVECQSREDSTMVIRMVEYDFHIALEGARKVGGVYEMRFPQSCVLYLRHSRNTGDCIEMRLIMPDNQKVMFRVPVLKLQEYSQDEIFQKKLLLLLPFYVLKYEDSLKSMKGDCYKQELETLLSEYRQIQGKLDTELGEKEQGRVYSNLVELIIEISDYVFRDIEEAKKGVGDIMGGKLLELRSERLLREGRKEGRKEGLVIAYDDAGLSTDEIARRAGLTAEEVRMILAEESKLATV